MADNLDTFLRARGMIQEVSMNLVSDRWIPVLRLSGSIERVAPPELTDRLEEDPIFGLASPRADIDGALAQLWIGLLQATVASDIDEEDWLAWDDSPPTPEQLLAAMEPIAHAFELLGDGPRFLQDLELREGDGRETPVGKLLIDRGTTGGASLFVRGQEIDSLCLPCAAAALMALQSSAPSGGRGHRTSLRGGGPLTTLVVHADPEVPLWRSLWLNVLPADRFEWPEEAAEPGIDRSAPEHRFPWLAATRVSGKGGRDTTPMNAHPLQRYFGMPRRIRILGPDGPDRCGLCGELAEATVGRYVTKDLGVNYTGPWRHPLTPYRQGNDGVPISLKGSADEICYRDWIGLVLASAEKGVTPAEAAQQAIHGWLPELSDSMVPTDGGGEALWGLWAFGYAMDNMKPRAWCEGKMPVLPVDPAEHDVFVHQASRLIAGAEQAEFGLQMAVKKLIRKRLEGMGGKLEALDLQFWRATEAPFYRLARESLERIRQRGGDEPSEALRSLRQRWHRFLEQETSRLFDQRVDQLDLRAVDPRQVAEAWHSLRGVLYGKKMRSALALPDKAPVRPTNADGEEAKT